MFGQGRIKAEDRVGKLSQLLREKKLIRVIEAHNGISALIANNVNLDSHTDKGKEIVEFDAIWASGLTDSASKGLPDTELVSLDSRLNTIEQIANITTKPIIVDGDTGRDQESLEYFITKLERLGVSSVIIEDKTFPKRNSLDPDAIQNLENSKVFASKIRWGKTVLLSKEFMILARIESLIAGKDVSDAIVRAKEYLLNGVDGIVIHSKERDPSNVLKFAVEYNKLCEELEFRKPLICIPTTYNTITEKELERYGFNIVIYANQLLRSAVKVMEDVSKTILHNGRAFETDPFCVSTKKIFDMVGFTLIKQRDIERSLEQSKSKVIIPAAGEPKKQIIKDTPTSILDINGKSVLQRQLDVINMVGITDIKIIRGYEKDKFNVNRVNYYDVDNYKKGGLHSLFKAKEEMSDGFILIFSDILFDEAIINNLLRAETNITLVADASFPFHRHEQEKELDLIIGKQIHHYRVPSLITPKEVSFIDKKISKDLATHEFIGIAKFSSIGAQSLISVYEDCSKNHRGNFHSAKHFENASITDMLQEMIDRDYEIHYIETNKGWMEIHNEKDYEMAKKIIH